MKSVAEQMEKYRNMSEVEAIEELLAMIADIFDKVVKDLSSMAIVLGSVTSPEDMLASMSLASKVAELKKGAITSLEGKLEEAKLLDKQDDLKKTSDPNLN